MRAQVLLINPPSSWYRPNPSRVVPTNLVALAGHLFRGGIHSRILDLSNLVDRDNQPVKDRPAVDRHPGKGFGGDPHGPEPPIEIGNTWMRVRAQIAQLLDEEPAIRHVGVAFNWSDMRRQSLEVCRIVKEMDPSLRVIIGGEHATCFPERYESMPWIDRVAVGQGEHQIHDFVSGVEGDARKVVFKEMPMAMNFLLDDFDSYIPFFDGHREGWYVWQKLPAQQVRALNLSGARGCPYECGFCSTAFFHDNKVHMRDAEHIAMEMEYYHREYGVNYFRIDDDTFALGNKRVTAFADALLRRRLKVAYECQTRVDKINDEVIRTLEGSGCASLGLGIESGSEYIRTERINKGIKIPQKNLIENLLRLRESPIPFALYLIVGYPGETDESIQETVDLVRMVRPDYVSPVRLELRPGTPVWEYAKKEHGLGDDLWFETDCPIFYNRASIPDAPFSDEQTREWMRRIRQAWVDSMSESTVHRMEPTIQALEKYYGVRFQRAVAA